MLQVLKFPAIEALRPATGLGPARKLLRAVLLRAAQRARQLAARLEAAEALARERAAAPVARPYAPAGAVGVRLVEVVVGVAVAAYFVAGLVGVVVG